MNLYRAFDASIPPSSAPPGVHMVWGYIGGNTPHVWTLAEWQRFANLAQTPIWVGAQEADPAGHAQQCVAQMRSLGWAPFKSYRRSVVVDMETQVDAPWINAFAAEIWSGGFQTMVYDSLYVAMDNPTKEGCLVADWTNVPHIPQLANVVGCQYQADVPFEGTQVDYSIVTSAVMQHAGYGARG